MLVFAATALAGSVSVLGWPCQRLNWGWRNVWTTCSINSYTPLTTFEDTPSTIPTGFRVRGTALGPNTPTGVLAPSGIFTPVVTTGVPNLICAFGPNTGSGFTAVLRNRCRRAIDAYGQLVKSCGLAPHLAGARGPTQGPNAVGTGAAPDFAPSGGHQPHVSNVQGLTHNAQMCLLPTGAHVPSELASPATTCPGLLGWFTVVFNACGFSNAPNLSPSVLPNTNLVPGNVAQYFPIGDVVNKGATGFNFGTVAVGTGAGYFCSTPSTTGGIPSVWNQGGAAFRTSRCRKALDQFGRTASRCASSSASIAAGPAQAGGYADPLRLLAVGHSPSTTVPLGFNSFTPACN